MKTLRDRISLNGAENGCWGMFPNTGVMAVSGDHIYLGLVDSYASLTEVAIIPNLTDTNPDIPRTIERVSYTKFDKPFTAIELADLDSDIFLKYILKHDPIDVMHIFSYLTDTTNMLCDRTDIPPITFLNFNRLQKKLEEVLEEKGLLTTVQTQQN